jgi:pilus assembly protein CpaF
VYGAAPGEETDGLREKVLRLLTKEQGHEALARASRRDLVRQVSMIVSDVIKRSGVKLDLIQQRDLVTGLIEDIAAARGGMQAKVLKHEDGLTKSDAIHRAQQVTNRVTPSPRAGLEETKNVIQPILMQRIDVSTITDMPRVDLEQEITDVVAEILIEEKVQLNLKEQQELVSMLLDDMLGLGPLEPLLADDSINDIMVNGHRQVFVERAGKLELSSVRFRDDQHVLNVATRIVTRIGRRVDETTPLVDARLEDGSRVNIIIPPLAIDGPSISIRKFSKKTLTLDVMARQHNMSEEVATVLKIASRCRLNILISGGTGSGKTTLLNAMSQMIDHGERIVTIEDAAELQLQQPHIVRLETRTANLEGTGEIAMRDLLKNSLRMRPDRIILGEVRGGECLDMLQAMNTGHDGSMCTIHANNPREALTRLENMVAMSGVQLPAKAVRAQTASAINLIVQISRMRDGMRRIQKVVEVVGMEEEVITIKDLFWFDYEGEENGKLIGKFQSSGLRPAFVERARYFGLDRVLLEAMACSA